MGEKTNEQKAKSKRDSNADRSIRVPNFRMPNIRSMKRKI